ncbi:MAG TPA: hypothetical protein VFE58_01595 [Tepidisphaeraceae bacterium]|nr:hypothetical protein [Tepidisphaeraceae bacterium]
MQLRTTGIVLAGIIGMVGFAQHGRASVAASFFQFDVTATPSQALSDSVLHYSTRDNPSGNTISLGDYPANIATDNRNIVVAPFGGIATLEPSYTWFSLYSVTEAGLAPVYGIAVAINNSAYATLGGATFDSLFDTNVDAAYNDGQSHTEADLINQFLTNGSPDAAFTTGISNTSEAEIPYGQSGPIVFFSTGTLGGTIEATVVQVPEPGVIGVVVGGVMGLVSRRRR